MIPETKFHFTLALLCLPDNGPSVERVVAALHKCLLCERSFTQSVAGLSSFGSRVVFAEAAGEDALRRLQVAVERGIREECGELEHREDREWRAHCTLFKGGKSRNDLPLLQEEEGKTTLFGSQLIGAVSLCRMGGGSATLGYVTPAEVPLLRTATFVEFADNKKRVLDACYVLEELSYPADEAATLERMQLRANHASDLFLVLLRGEEVLGFVNATACSVALTAETMGEHDERGTHVCIHSVVVAPSYRGKGLAKLMFGEYVVHLQRLARFESAHLLCKEELVAFYEKSGGFVCGGPSAVQHGSTRWFDCSRLL